MGAGNVKVYSHAERRYYCTTCEHTFSADKGTFFGTLRTEVNKILHQPMIELKRRALEGDGHFYCQIVTELFGLEQKESASKVGRRDDEA